MDMREIRFGVEVETIKKTREQTAHAIQSVVGGAVRHAGYPACYDPWEVLDLRGRKWKVVADASLTSVPKHLQAEIVSPILTYEDIPQLQEIIRAVRRAGNKCDRKCGIHLHVDASVFDVKAVGRLAKIFYKQETLILHAFGIHRERQRYCRACSGEFIRRIERDKPNTMEALNRAWYGYQNNQPQHYDSSRYCCLNIHNIFFRGTIELRAANAVLHAGKIKAYLQFFLALAAKAINARAASSRKRTFNPESAKYDLRVFLLALKMTGDEFKTARKHLMANMPGDAAFKTRAQRDKHNAKRKGLSGYPVTQSSGCQLPVSG